MAKKQKKSGKLVLEIRSRESYPEGMTRLLVCLHLEAARMLTLKSRIHINIHEVRTHLKKIRGILRLIRDEIGDEQYLKLNAFYRELAKEIALVRDDTSQMELLSRFASKIKSVALKRALGHSMEVIRAKRSGHFDEFYASGKDAEIQKKLTDQVVLIKELKIAGKPEKFISASLRRIYSRARIAMSKAIASNTNEDYHYWRKQVKYLTYHLQILRKAWPAHLESYADELGRLSSVLGDIHDQYLLKAHIREGVLASLTEEMKGHLLKKIYKTHKIQKKKALFLGARIFGESPRRFSGRLYAIWVSTASRP
jgi:CHAD domain-containing protein